MTKYMKVVLYIPTDSSGLISGPEEEVREALLKMAGGFTHVLGWGAWKSSAGETIQELVALYTAFCEDTQELREALSVLAYTYMQEAEQECVLYELNGEPRFIYADKWDACTPNQI